jgi:hypothetical protein
MVEARPVSRADVVAEARSWIGTPYLSFLKIISANSNDAVPTEQAQQ